MGVTSIEWADHSINPIRARHRPSGAVGHYCEKISGGCSHCYASGLQRRFRMAEFPPVGSAQTNEPGPDGTVPLPGDRELFFDHAKLAEVLRRRVPTAYFWCDMTDLFGTWIPHHWRNQCFQVMAATPWHRHMVLTKRAKRARSYAKLFPWLGKRLDPPLDAFFPYICSQRDLPNVWWGVSIESSRFLRRAGQLVLTKAAVRFVSAEPLLGEIDLTPYLPGLQWVIVGGESGPGARRCDVAWVRRIVGQCQRSGVPVFVKQLGARPTSYGGDWKLRDRKGGDPSEWPDDLRVRQFPADQPPRR